MDKTIAGSVSGLKKFFGIKRAWIFVGCNTDIEDQFIIDEINFFEAVFVKAKFWNIVFTKIKYLKEVKEEFDSV